MLPKEVADAIEAIVQKGHNVKISRDRQGGYHLYEERVKKVALGVREHEAAVLSQGEM